MNFRTPRAACASSPAGAARIPGPDPATTGRQSCDGPPQGSGVLWVCLAGDVMRDGVGRARAGGACRSPGGMPGLLALAMPRQH
jgi:hypothetical protein